MGLYERLQDRFGPDALVWLDRAYLLDWFIAVLIWITAYIPHSWPVFERGFSIDDALISHPHTHQQISGTKNWQIALFLPAGVVLLTGSFKKSLMDIHHGLLSLGAASAISHLITEVLKNRVGRLRPDFLARCQYDYAAKRCTGKLKDIVDGRRSFPSGHSSTAWAGMMFLALYVAGHTGALCSGAPARSGSFFASRMLALTLVLLPLFWSTWVAVSRVEDYRHHKEDVIVGSLIGAFSSLTTYFMYWHNPFSWRTFSAPERGGPRVVYMDVENVRQNDGFELTSMDEEHGAV